MQATTTMTLKEEAESYFGGPIPKNEYDVAVDRAKRKLARIIEREGDSNGERRKQYYLAQLISEEVQANRFSDFTIAVCKAYEEIDRYVEQIQKRDKKRNARSESRKANLNPYLYCITNILKMQ